MPKRVVAWACSFGCGRQVSTKKSTIEKHEQTCKLNPDRRACPTCAHEESDPDYGFYCVLGLLDDTDEQMRFDCSMWEVRE